MAPVVFTLCAQEKERAWHQQELDKALKSLEREKTELEMRLREQQAETEAVRMQREEERAEAESTLRQVGSWEDWLCCHPVTSYLWPLPFPLPREVLQGLPRENIAPTLRPMSR